MAVKGNSQGAVMQSARVTHSSVPAAQEQPSKKTRTAVKVEEVRVRTPPQPIGRAASSRTVSLSQVAQREEFNDRLFATMAVSVTAHSVKLVKQQLTFYELANEADEGDLL